MPFAAIDRGQALRVTAPDGSEVRVLCQTPRGSMARFSLSAGAVSRPVAHRSVDEIWYFLGGRGRMWRKRHEEEEVIEVREGISVSIEVGTQFQFRCDSTEELAAVAVTMPPWPGDGEAYAVAGTWDPTV
jgi:mannose-6-phosphate isomerase-like protein (cupin superfamily)